MARALDSATPGGSATGRFAFASAEPSRRIVSAGISVRAATASAPKPESWRAIADAAPPISPSGPLAASTAARAIASARIPSVPGLGASHSSDWLAVSSRRGPT